MFRVGKLRKTRAPGLRFMIPFVDRMVKVSLRTTTRPIESQQVVTRDREAGREKRAKIIAAEGEALSAGKLAEAADVIRAHPIALQLRNLRVLSEIAIEKNSTIIFPAQFMDTVRSLTQFVESETGETDGTRGAT